MSKWYAVKVGTIPGLYQTWAACETQVKGVRGAIHKSFKTKKEAEAFLVEGTNDEKKHVAAVAAVAAPLAMRTTVVTVPEEKKRSVANRSFGVELWTDGSAALGRSAGCGWVILHNPTGTTREGKFKIRSGLYTAPQAEVYALVHGMTMCVEMVTKRPGLITYSPLLVCSDSEFAVNTLNGINKGKAYANEFKWLMNTLAEWRRHAPAVVEHVSAHTGLVHNERADALAEEARLCDE